MGATSQKISRAEEGDTVAFQKLDSIETGDRFAEGKATPAAPAKVPPPPPTQSVAMHVKDRKDEVRVAAALAKLTEEDTALGYVQDQESSEMKLYGQGEMHLRVTIERLDDRFGVKVETRKPTVAYRETIRETVTVHGRHKKQSGGHGQFGDVIVEVGPRDRGEGYLFTENVHGGTVPRQYFSSVEAGAKDALTRGPLGFQVVDVLVNLIDGSYHTVDLSDMAFRAAAKLALGEALPKAKPILLEPIQSVTIYVPLDALARASALVTARRGQFLASRAGRAGPAGRPFAPDSGGGDRRPHRRAEKRDRRRGRFREPVRPPRRTLRPPGGAGGGSEEEGAGGAVRFLARPPRPRGPGASRVARTLDFYKDTIDMPSPKYSRASLARGVDRESDNMRKFGYLTRGRETQRVAVAGDGRTHAKSSPRGTGVNPTTGDR